MSYGNFRETDERRGLIEQSVEKTGPNPKVISYCGLFGGAQAAVATLSGRAPYEPRSGAAFWVVLRASRSIRQEVSAPLS
jgi:hypothetical protein